jgi:hypothetical protein
MNPDIIHALEIAAVVVAGTMTGSELAVAVSFTLVSAALRTWCISELLRHWRRGSAR